MLGELHAFIWHDHFVIAKSADIAWRIIQIHAAIVTGPQLGIGEMVDMEAYEQANWPASWSGPPMRRLIQAQSETVIAIPTSDASEEWLKMSANPDAPDDEDGSTVLAAEAWYWATVGRGFISERAQSFEQKV